MTNKEFAERLRDMVRSTDMIVAETREEHPPMLSVDPREVVALADELDPPRPKAGTVVVRHGEYGIIDCTNEVVTVGPSGMVYKVHTPDWKPAHILAPGEVAVTIPAVREWLVDAVDMTLSWTRRVRDGKVPVPIPYKTIITRAEAERMEAET